MTTESYLRANAREAKIYKPFVYSFPFDADQTIERNIIFGLYANSHLNQNKYMLEIETEDLVNLLSDYNLKMSELTTAQQNLVADIVSKRYLDSIDQLIHDQKMAAKLAGIEADDDLWDAKIAALAADTAALDTLAAKVASETEKNTARIAELQAYIEIEALHLSEANVEVVEKEIQKAKIDIQKLETANEVLKIQIATVNAAQEIVDISLKIARTKVDVAETTRTINKIDLLGSELTIEQARTDIAEAELPVAAAKVTLAEAKTVEMQEEINHVATSLQQEKINYDNRIDLMNVKHAGMEERLTMQKIEKELELQTRLNLSNLEVYFAEADKYLQPKLDAEQIKVWDANAWNVWLKTQAAISVAKKLATASIATTLTHTIGKKKP